MTVVRSGKYNAGNGGEGRGLRHTALGPGPAWLRRRIPNLFAIRYAESSEAAALRGIGRQSYLDDRTRRRLPYQVGDRRVDLLPIAGHAPLYAAIGAALADASLPQDLALLIRVQRVNHARLLSSE